MFTMRLVDTPSAHYEHTSTTLSDGSVLVTGGYDAMSELHATCGRFYPASGRWGPAAELSGPSHRHSATLLTSGHVLVVGIGVDVGRAAIYDPDNNAWQPVAIPEIPRIEHGAALLPDGRVIICGGRSTEALAGVEGPDRRDVPVLKSTEIFDPKTASWSDGPDMTTARRKFALLTLGDGSLLAVGGKGVAANGTKKRLTNAERFFPGKSAWSRAGSTDSPERDLVLLADGTVLGHDGHVYDPETNKWRDVEPGFRGGGPLMLLTDGRVACIGLRGDEVYDPETEQWTPSGEGRRLMQRGQHLHVIGENLAFVVGGSPGRRKGLPLSTIIDIDIDPDALLTPEDSDEATGAEELLKMLVENDKLALEEGHFLAELLPRVDRILRFYGTPGAKAQAMSRYLVDAEPVYDLFMDDRDLRKLLQQW
ncbi:MAG: hypothetical protein KC502_06890 [Myxococcales bacterium]|nr:hypothetical protein [Myxococcales bacterium]